MAGKAAIPKPAKGGDKQVFDLLVRASRAHWATDFQEMTAVQEQFDVFKTAFANSFVLAELRFLINSVLSLQSDPPSPQTRLTEKGSTRPLKFEVMMESLWQALIWAGERLSQGRYPDAVLLLNEYLPFSGRLPAAYRLRLSVIQGICYQAMGLFRQAAQELLTQRDILSDFPSAILDFAVLRRRLSFALETENLQSAFVIQQEMENKVTKIASPFLLTLFYQERIKLSIFSGDATDVQGSQVIQESLLAKSKIPPKVVIPLEERCETALLALKPRNALQIVAKQAWVSRENGLINGQLIAAMILLQCQLQLGQIQAARITLNELKYLCKQYTFGRDALRARILEAIWYLGYDDKQTGHNLLASALHMAQGMGLRIHSWAIKIFGAVLDPTQEKLVEAFPSGERSIREFRASLFLVKKWFLVLKWQERNAYRLVLLLLDDHRPFAFNSIGFPECGAWMIVSFSGQDGVRFEIARFANGSLHDIWLRLLLSTDFPQGAASLHAAASPRVVYARARHRTAVLVGLQKMRARLRSSFKHFLNVAPPHSGSFGLQNENALRLIPLPSLWRSETKSHATSSPTQRSTKSKKTALQPGQTTKRNNLPKLSSTIAEKSDRIVRWLETYGPSSGSEMALGMGLARKSLHFYLKRLVDLRKVSLSGLGRNAVYSLNANLESPDEG